MKRMFLLLASGLLATTVAFAQDMPSSTTERGAQDQTATSHAQADSGQSSVIRGCLSGSAGNYTLTDQNGMQYRVTGDDTVLQGKSGHEVEITTQQVEGSQASNMGDQSAANTMSAIQVSDAREVASSCSSGRSTGSPPMSEQNPTSPKGTPDSAEPPRPQMIAMAQQAASPVAGTQQPASSASQQSTPPVTSQTPVAPASPTNANPQATAPRSTTTTTTTTTTQQQAGTSPANNTGMTESEANHDAQAARQSELNANPQTGQTTGRGVNNQGVNNPSSTNPNAVPTSPNSALPSGEQQPPANTNDQNKPLYERQATDIPWAQSPGGNRGTPPPPH